jgi:hypothetical protein
MEYRTHRYRNHLRGNLLHGRVENKTGVPLETHPFLYYYHENQFISTNLGRIKSPV